MADGDVAGGAAGAGRDAELFRGLQEALAIEQAKNQVLIEQLILNSLKWRRGRDSNPRYLAARMISSHVHSTRLCHPSAEMCRKNSE